VDKDQRENLPVYLDGETVSGTVGRRRNGGMEEIKKDLMLLLHLGDDSVKGWETV
jgi:hypothetical protein